MAPLRLRWRLWWQQRWRRWWQQRHPPADTLVLTQRNVYIVPTGAGWLFAALLLVLLVAAINYQLNLGYLLTFVLAGIGLASMHTTHATLRGLQAQLDVGEPVFAGNAVAITVGLAASPRERHGIALRLDGAAEAVWVDMAAGAAATIELSWPVPRRGLHALPRLTLETRYPYGLFRAWSYWQPAARACAWPALEQPAPALPWGGDTSEPAAAPAGRGEEPDGARPYRRGDPLPQVLWKKSAQALAGGGGLIVRDRAARRAAPLALRWQDAGGHDAEQRLSRLAAWVVAADRAQLPWSLALPGLAIGLQQGPAHRRACLDALATWQPGAPR